MSLIIIFNAVRFFTRASILPLFICFLKCHLSITRQIVYMTGTFGLMFGSIIRSFIWFWHAQVIGVYLMS